MGEDMAKKIDPTNLYVLPSDNQELSSFTKRYKVDMMEQVANQIEWASANNLPLAEVFQFKNSDFVITVFEKDYLSNIDNIYNYYMQQEVYEFCPRIIKLRQTLKEKSVKTTDENQKNRKQ